MTQDEIIEMAIQGHASTRDAIRWAMNQERERMTDAAMKAAEKAVDVAIKLEREACAMVCDDYDIAEDVNTCDTAEGIAIAIRARGREQSEPVAFKIYKPTPLRHATPNVQDAELPWVYDQDPLSGNVASMWVTPVQALRKLKEKST